MDASMDTWMDMDLSNTRKEHPSKASVLLGSRPYLCSQVD